MVGARGLDPVDLLRVKQRQLFHCLRRQQTHFPLHKNNVFHGLTSIQGI